MQNVHETPDRWGKSKKGGYHVAGKKKTTVRYCHSCGEVIMSADTDLCAACADLWARVQAPDLDSTAVVAG